jgi:hypothetical protein
MQRRSRVLGRPSARAASGGNPSLPWLPRAVVPRDAVLCLTRPRSHPSGQFTDDRFSSTSYQLAAVLGRLRHHGRRGTASPLLFFDGVVHVPEVGASAPLRMGLVLVLGVFVDPHRPHPSPGGTPTVVGAPPNGPSGLSSQRVGPGPSSYWDELRSGGKAHPKRVMTATGPAATVRSTRQTGARSSRHRRDWQMTKASEHRSARRVQETSGWTAGLILLAAIMQ